MQDKIQEIMGLVESVIDSAEWAEYESRAGRDFDSECHKQDYRDIVFEIESKLRELVRVPLTEQEIGVVIDTTEDESEYGHHHFGFFKDFTRNVERAHNITNTSN